MARMHHQKASSMLTRLRAMSLPMILLMVLLCGCTRLNPDWCDEHANCDAGEICDPETNTCRPKSVGLPDGSLDMHSQE